MPEVGKIGQRIRMNERRKACTERKKKKKKRSIKVFFFHRASFCYLLDQLRIGTGKRQKRKRKSVDKRKSWDEKYIVTGKKKNVDI